MGYRGMSAAQPPVEFAQQHFGNLELGDLRLTRRAAIIAQKMAAQPHASIPKQCDTTHEAKGAYRFFDHSAVNTQSVTEQHPRPIPAPSPQHVALSPRPQGGSTHSGHHGVELRADRIA